MGKPPLLYIGTSGWMYNWNLGGSLEWYAEHSGLNAVELNASFYRFPFLGQVASWSRKGSSLRWSVKVNQAISHYRKLGASSYRIWESFRKSFAPMEGLIDYYLVQLPPSIKCVDAWLRRIEEFVAFAGIGKRLAIEYRSTDCYSSSMVKHSERNNYVVVSVDSPISRWIVPSNGRVYLRLHGSTEWYSHRYTVKELVSIAENIVSLDPEVIHVFFNNDHWMLENALSFKELMHRLLKKT